MGEVLGGRYELTDPIGHGGAGEVWRAWDHHRERYVAVKVLKHSDAHSLLRFVREQALRIDHPHVLAPSGWSGDDDKVLLAMGLMTGGSLSHLVGDYGPLPPGLVCTLLDQLLDGLTAVHAEDVVHRDIKPANILLEATGTRRPHLRLSDFGIAMRKGEPRLTETRLVVGTPGCFAPEQLQGHEPDFPADLYAVGLVALHLLTGERPDSTEVVARFARGVPEAPEQVPEPLWQVLGRLLQPEPQLRLRTATAAREALAAAAEMLPPDSRYGPDGPYGSEGPDGSDASDASDASNGETVEVFDHMPPLPEGFGPDGPTKPRPSADRRAPADGPAPARDASRPVPASIPAPAPASDPAGHVPAGGATDPASGGSAGAGTADSSGTAATSASAPPPVSPSTTGSFQLAPPRGAFGGPVPPGGPVQPGAPAPAVPAQQSATAPPQDSAPYATPAGFPAPSGPARVRRPGPPPAVAVPVLLTALALLAAGIWALAVS